MVEVSIDQMVCTSHAAGLLMGMVCGRRFSPFGNSRYSSRQIAMPENITAHR